MMPIFHRFHQALCQALPDLPVDKVVNRLLFAIGSMAHAVMSRHGHDGMNQATEGGASINIDDLIEQLIAFVTHGMEGAA
ncbi:MAG: hypothetical protein JRH15_10695 [Deltaproteobacteria bacterium]|nr:hypothetical protein [Deltaproteobacteria bacterium]